MKTKPSSSATDNHAFTQALGRVVSVSRAEMQKRIERAKPEPTSLHKRFSYVPSKAVERG